MCFLKKIFIYPPSSLILSDVVEHFGHKPLTMMEGVKRAHNIRGGGAKSCSSVFEPRRGLKYASVELPSGVRGRLAILGRLIEEADAAIIMEGADFGFGCSGCARTNELIPYIVLRQGIPYIKVDCPSDLETAKVMVKKIKEFLTGLGDSR